MIALILTCAGLVLLSGVFYLLPSTRSGSTEADLDRANLEWFRLRRLELAAEGNESLDEDARLRLLEDEPVRSNAPMTSTQRFPVWFLLPAVALLASVLYYFLGAAQDVELAKRLQNLPDDMTVDQMNRLVMDVEARSLQRPDNLYYVSMLGRYYMGQEDYTRALQSYNALIQAVPEDPQMLAYAAQAEYLLAGRELNANARLRAEQALAADPQQRTALGLLGMAAFEEQQYDVSIAYWQRLLDMESPDSENRQMLAGVMETARQRIAASAPAGSVPIVAEQAKPATDSGVGVTVSVSVPADADITPTDTVFILARNADSQSRMPIAVERLTGAQLPVTLRLDDSNSMAGQKLSTTSSVIVAVQVSPSGRPGDANARWVGKSGPIAPGIDDTPLSIVLVPNTR